MYNHLIGKNVLIRANRAGVWVGILAGADGHILRLTGARRLWSWSGALDCSVLAQRGASSAKAGDVSDCVLGPSAEVIEVHAATDEAAAKVAALPRWAP